MSFPDLPDGTGVPLLDLTTDLFVSSEVMAALDARYAGGGTGGGSVVRVVVVTGDEARPAVDCVIWLGGGAQPTNMIDGDIWFDDGGVAPTPTAPTITTTTLNTLTVGAAFSQTIAKTGTAPITFAVTVGALPAGLSLNGSTGAITGTPTTAGAYSFTLTATNTVGSDTQAYSGTVGATATAPTITTTTIAAMTEGVVYSQSLAATGSTPITWGISAGSLPAGVGINSSTGALSGTPTTPGAYSFTVQATNSAGSDTQAYSGTVAAGGGDVFSVWGSATPGTGDGIFSDGGGSLTVGNRFYGAVPITVRGVRVWNPAESDSTFLNLDITVTAHPTDWLGGALEGYSLAAPARTKVHTAARVAGTWTDVLFDTPLSLNAINTGVNSPDVVTLAVQYAGGNHYVVVTGIPDASVESPDADVHLSEKEFYRGAISPAGHTQSYYGIDILFEVP